MGLRPVPMPTVEPKACWCNVRFCGSFWATVGRAADARLEEEVAVLVGEVAGEDSGTSSSRDGKTAKTDPIGGSGSQPSIMF